MFEVTVRIEKPRRLAAVAHRGPYNEIGGSFEKLGTIIGGRGLWPRMGSLIGLYPDDPKSVPAGELQSYAGVTLPSGMTAPDGLVGVTAPGGRFAVARFRGHYSGIQAVYDYLFGPWLAQSGAELRNVPAIEVYLNTPVNTAPDDLLTDVCMPLV